MMQNKKRVIKFGFIVIAAIIVMGSAYFFVYNTSLNHKNTTSPVGSNLATYTAASLSQYDGTNDKLPIYVALDGYVYDVTPGKEFYIPGGIYHRIAGKDGSSELHIFGGDIIKEKYKIVGIFSN